MILLQNAVIVTSEKEAEGSVLIDGDRIAGVFWKDEQDYETAEPASGDREEGSQRKTYNCRRYRSACSFP